MKEVEITNAELGARAAALEASWLLLSLAEKLSDASDASDIVEIDRCAEQLQAVHDDLATRLMACA